MQNAVPDWSKAYLIRPRNHIKSHVFIDEKVRFRPSFENDNCRPPMSCLLGWEYARKWLQERDDFYQARADRTKPKRIKNNYGKWLEKRKPLQNSSCKPVGANKLAPKPRKSSGKS